MKNVLIVTSSFPPMIRVGALRPAKFAKFLPEFGWNPLVLTVPAKERVPGPPLDSVSIYRAAAPSLAPIFNLGRRLFPRKVKQPSTVNITGFQGRGPRLTSWFFVPDKSITWAPFAIRMGLKVARQQRVKAIISSSPDESCHLVAGVLSRLLGCAWVADFRDPWITNPFHLYPTPLHRRINVVLEQLVIRRAHLVVTVSETWRDDWVARYPALASDKFRVIANGFDPDDFTDSPHLTTRGDFIQIVHNGALFYAGKDPFPFLQATRLLADNGELTDVKINFVGVPASKLKSVIHNMELDQIVKLTDRLPHKESLEYVLNADILLLISGPGRGVLTAKVYEYLAAGKPILALTPPAGTLADLLSQTNVAEVVDPDSPQSIAAGLRNLIGQVRTGQSLAPNRAFVQQFSRRNQTRLLAGCLDESCQGLARMSVETAINLKR